MKFVTIFTLLNLFILASGYIQVGTPTDSSMVFCHNGNLISMSNKNCRSYKKDEGKKAYSMTNNLEIEYGYEVLNSYSNNNCSLTPINRENFYLIAVNGACTLSTTNTDEVEILSRKFTEYYDALKEKNNREYWIFVDSSENYIFESGLTNGDLEITTNTLVSILHLYLILSIARN